MIKYVFDEDRILKELKEYVDNTYSEHYASQGRIQVTEFIQSQLDTPDFFRGNVLKYTARYGHKDGYNRKDLLKAMHYLLMLMSYHDKANLPKNVTYKMEDIVELPANTIVKANTVPEISNTALKISDILPVDDVLIENAIREVANIVSVDNNVLTQNVYVQLGGGLIGQKVGDGRIEVVGYGELDEKGHLKKDTFRFSTDIQNAYKEKR